MATADIQHFTIEKDVTPFRLFVNDLQLHFKIFYHMALSKKVIATNYADKLFRKVSAIRIHYCTLAVSIRMKIRRNGHATNERSPNFPEGVNTDDLRDKKLLPQKPMRDMTFIGIGDRAEYNIPHEGQHEPKKKNTEIKACSMFEISSDTESIYKISYTKFHKHISGLWFFILDLSQYLKENFNIMENPTTIQKLYGIRLWKEKHNLWKNHYYGEISRIRSEARKLGNTTYIGHTMFLNIYKTEINQWLNL